MAVYEQLLAILSCLQGDFNQKKVTKKKTATRKTPYSVYQAPISRVNRCVGVLCLFSWSLRNASAAGVITEAASVYGCGPDIGPLANPP